MRLLKFIAVCCFSAILTVHTYSQVIPKEEKLLSIRNEIKEMVEDSIIPSMAVAVVKDGTVLWQEAIGYADVGDQKPADIHSVYPLGSVSKSITATGIMQLVNSGRLSLNDDIRPLIKPVLLKDINGETPKIALWQLVSMNGGINHGYGVYEEEKYLPKDEASKKKFYEESTIVAFQPGATYEYSNRAFYLAEYIIEIVSNSSFQEFMVDHVYEPIGMQSTFAYPYQYPENTNFVKTYTTRGLNEIENKISYPVGGSGLWSSIHDMTQYALFHLGNIKNDEVISKENLKLMHEFRQGPADLFGIGWFNSDGKLYSNGNVTGGNAAISVDKKNKLGVICLLNKTSWEGLADQYVSKIKRIYVDEPETGYQEWKRIYGTPYTSRKELSGKWQGTISEPLTGNSFRVELMFDETDKVQIKIDDQDLEVNDPTYNLLRELEGGFKTILPGITESETRCGFKLKHEGNQLSGYVQYDSFTSERYYRLPLFMKLIRI